MHHYDNYAWELRRSAVLLLRRTGTCQFRSLISDIHSYYYSSRWRYSIFAVNVRQLRKYTIYTQRVAARASPRSIGILAHRRICSGHVCNSAARSPHDCDINRAHLGLIITWTSYSAHSTWGAAIVAKTRPVSHGHNIDPAGKHAHIHRELLLD